MSYTNFAENAIEAALCNATAFSVGQLYLKLHIGDPGEDATANPAVETTRKAVTFGATGNPRLNTAIVTWTNVATTETYSYGSLWDAATGGNPWKVGPLAIAKAVNAGDSFDFAVGEIASSTD